MVSELGPEQLTDRPFDSPRKILNTLLLHFNIQQHKRMQPQPHILLYPPKPTIRPPPVRPERNTHRLAERIQLEPTGAHGIHDARIMHDLHGDAQFAGAEDNIGVGGRAEWIAYDEEADGGGGCAGEDGVRGGLDHVPVRQEDFTPIEGFLRSRWS